MSEQILLRFDAPVKIGQVEVPSITIRPPLLKDEILAAAQSVTRTMDEANTRLIGLLTGLSFESLRNTRSAVRRVLTGAVDSMLLDLPPRQVDRKADATTITFTPPVQIGGMEVATVTLRDPMVEEELTAAAHNKSGTNQEAEARLIGLMTGLCFDALAETGSAVYRVLYVELLRFLEAQPKTSVERLSTSPASAKVDSAGTPSAA